MKNLFIIIFFLASFYKSQAFDKNEDLSTRSKNIIPPFFPSYVQDSYGLWYLTFETEHKRVKTLWATQNNIKAAENILNQPEYKKGAILDIGAHIGTFSLPLSLTTKRNIYCF